MVGGLVTAIVNLLTKGPDRPSAIDSSVPVIVPSAADRTSTFSSQLEFLADPDHLSAPLVAGSVEVLGLDDVRDALGPLWAAVGDRARQIVEAEIEADLDEGDFYLHYRNLSFVICFGSSDRDAADRRARELGFRVRSKLIEEIPEIAQVIGVDHFVAEVDRAALRTDDFSITDQLFGTLQRMRTEAHAAARRSRLTLLRDVQLQFAPAWHTGKNVVVLNRCILDMSAGCRTLAQFQALAEPTQIGRTLAELDCTLLTKALETLHQNMTTRGSSALLVPVSFRTVDDATWCAEYVRLLEFVPEAYKAYLIIEICDIPDATPPARLGELARRLNLWAKGASLELTIDYPGLDAILEESPWAVAVSVGGVSSIDPQVPQRLKRFVAAASAARTISLAHGANSIGLAVAAFEAGFSHIDGPAVHPTLREPKAPSPLNPLRNSSFNSKSTRW
jgi:GGDEF domain-containing protein